MPLKPLSEIGRANRRCAFPLNAGREFVKVNGSVPHNRMLFLFLILSGPFRSSHSPVPLRNMRFCGTEPLRDDAGSGRGPALSGIGAVRAERATYRQTAT
jgi:hypothetical protein